MWHVWGKGEACAGVWWENFMERGNLEDLGVDGEIILELIPNKSVGNVWAGLIWLLLGTSGRLL